MANYTKLTDFEFKEIFKIYALTGQIQYTPLSAGISNTNYKVSLAGQSNVYLLKIFNDKDSTALLAEYEILNYLKSKNFPYIELPYKTSRGQTYFSYKNHLGTLMKFLAGQVPPEGPEISYQIGGALASLHSLPMHENLRHYAQVGFTPQAILAFATDPTCPLDYKHAICQIFDKPMKEFMLIDFQKGIIHGDLCISNVLSMQNKLHAIIDFEQAGLEKVIYDIGITITGICTQNGQIDKKLMSAFLSGYQEIRILPAIEKKYLNQAILFGFLSMALWRIKKYRIKKINAMLADHYKEQLQKARDYHENL